MDSWVRVRMYLRVELSIELASEKAALERENQPYTGLSKDDAL